MKSEREAGSDEGAATERSQALVLLARLHAGYLGLVAAVPLFYAEPLHGTLFFFSFAPLAVWYTLLASSYRLTRNLPAALCVVMLVPLQAGLTTWGLGGAFLDFLLEEAVVEVLGLLLGLALAMAWRAPTGISGVLVVLLLVLTPWLGLLGNYLLGIRAWPLWAQAAIAATLASSTALGFTLFATAADRAGKTGVSQDVELLHGAEQGAPTQSLDLGARAGTAAPLLAVGVWFAALACRVVDAL